MTFAHKNLKITFGGDMFGGKEIWSNSLHVGHELRDFEYDQLTTSADVNTNIAGHIEAWFTRPGTNISTQARLTWIKFALIGTDGKYAATSDGGYEHLTVIDIDPVTPAYNSLSGSQNIAPQLSVALTMETAVRRGPGRYGRIYPPLSGYAVSGGLDYFTSERADSFKILLDDINAAFDEQTGDDGYKVIIASAVGTGVNAPVTKIKVGNVIDTQRRRRNAFKEAYQERPVVSNAAV